MQTAATIAARLDRLPASKPIWRLIVLLSLGGAFEFYDLFMTAYLAPGLVKAGVFQAGPGGLLGLTDQATFAAATFTGLFIGTLVFSQVADRFGRRAIFTGSLLWYCAATFVMAFQDTALGLDIWRLIAGIGLGVEMVTIDTYIVELAPRHVRGKALALNQAIQFTAVPIVALTCWLLLPVHFAGLPGWRWVILLGCIGAVFIWVIRRHIPESPRWLAQHGRIEEADRVVTELEARITASGAVLPEPGPPPPQVEGRGRFIEILRPPYLKRTVVLSVFNAAQTIGFYGFGNWVPSLIAAQGATITKSLQWSFIIAIAYPVGPLLFTAIADRFERKWQIVTAACCTASLGLLFAVARAPAAMIALGVGITLSNNLLSYAYHAYQAELFPTRIRARAVGFVYCWSRLSTVFTSLIIGWLLTGFGSPAVFIFIAGAMAVVVTTIGVFGPRTGGAALEDLSR